MTTERRGGTPTGAPEAAAKATSELGRLLLLSGRVGAELMGGSATAIARYYETFSRRLTAENVTRLDFDNGLLQAAWHGWSDALEEGRKTWDRAAKLVQAEPTTRAKEPPARPRRRKTARGRRPAKTAASS